MARRRGSQQWALTYERPPLHFYSTRADTAHPRARMLLRCQVFSIDLRQASGVAGATCRQVNIVLGIGGRTAGRMIESLILQGAKRLLSGCFCKVICSRLQCTTRNLTNKHPSDSSERRLPSWTSWREPGDSDWTTPSSSGTVIRVRLNVNHTWALRALWHAAH